MKECLGYSVDLIVATLHILPKTIQHCVLECFNAKEIKACRKFHKTKK